jgi:hypothetical protein
VRTQTDRPALIGAPQGCERPNNEVAFYVALFTYECTDIYGSHNPVLHRQCSLIGKRTLCVLGDGKVIPVQSQDRAMRGYKEACFLTTSGLGGNQTSPAVAASFMIIL